MLPAPAESSTRQVSEELHARLRHETGAPVLVLGEQVSGQDRAHAHARASRCLELARALGHRDAALATADLALYALVFDPARAGDLAELVDGAIGPLVDYDRRRGTDLVATLDAYFRHGANLARTARALHVHLNTLLKRLERTEVVLGRDWRAEDDLALRMAVRMHLLAAGGAAGERAGGATGG